MIDVEYLHFGNVFLEVLYRARWESPRVGTSGVGLEPAVGRHDILVELAARVPHAVMARAQTAHN